MDEASLSMTQAAFGAMGNSGPEYINPDDYQGLAVRFVMHPFPNHTKSKAEGRPIYDEIPFADIRIPGDRTSHIFRPANDLDKRKWPRHWQSFETNQQDPETGTPLREWPMITAGLVMELSHFNVRTVEQLAELSDTAIQNFMGLREWINRAKMYIANNDAAAAAQMASENQARDAQMAIQAEQIKELTAKLAEMESRDE